jgi:hypothetical protein
MADTLALGRYFEAWQHNHNQTDEELAAYLGVTVSLLADLAAEPIEPAGGTPRDGSDDARPMPEPPLATDLEPIAERHGVNGQRLRNGIYGRY